MDIRFVTGETAVVVDDALVVGELHIGYETEMYRKGVSLQSNSGPMLERLQGLIEDTGASRVILLGDLKHSYTGITKQEEREVPRFLRELAKYADVHVVPGNHDGLLKELLPDGVTFHPQTGVKHGEGYFIHGHAWPGEGVLESRVLIMAHIHPAVEFVDDLGFRSVEYCWLRGAVNKEALADHFDVEPADVSTEEVIVVPPFNNMIGGMPVNRADDDKDISPITRQGVLDIKKAKVHLLDGTDLGPVGKLKATKYERAGG